MRHCGLGYEMASRLIRITVRAAATVLAVALMNSCDWFSGIKQGNKPGNRLEIPGTGRYYMTEYNQKTYFVWFDTSDHKTAAGHYYVSENGTTVVRHDFSAKINQHNLDINTDGTVTSVKIKAGKTEFSDLEWRPYTEPTYRQPDMRLFQEPFCNIREDNDIVFGQAKGYWTSLMGVESDVSKAFTSGYIKSFRRKDLDLVMDLYRPSGVKDKRPLILFIHGGAFYVGDKAEPAYLDFCRIFSRMGYVTASINYRLGFHVGKGEIERAGYMALQDAHAALRYLVCNAAEYGIDTENIFVAGSSAGSITALNLAFMTERDRPESSYGGNGLFNDYDLGPIDGSGNNLYADFHIRAVANMWGAVSNLDILNNSSTDIISFHGDEDNVVPFAEGYPFSNVSDVIAKGLSGKMYGSACIDSVARSVGLKSRFVPFEGCGHALNTTGKDKQPNENHTLIKKEITSFFYNELLPSDAYILSEDDGFYFVEGNVSDVSFKVEGAFILGTHETSEDVNDKEIHLLWIEDAPEQVLKASGYYSNGMGFELVYKPWE